MTVDPDLGVVVKLKPPCLIHYEGRGYEAPQPEDPSLATYTLRRFGLEKDTRQAATKKELIGWKLNPPAR
jgi:hypothetical protein